MQRGLLSFLAREEEQRRHAQEAALEREREDRAARSARTTEDYTREMIATQRASRERQDAEVQRQADTELAANIDIGSTVDPATGARLRDRGLAAEAQTLPAQVLPMVHAEGVTTPGRELPAEGTGEFTFTGDADQRQREAALQDPSVPEHVKALMRAGGTPTAAMFEDQSKIPFRVSPDKGTIERQGETGEWVPHVGPLPENAYMMAQAQPRATGGDAEVLDQLTPDQMNNAIEIAAWQYYQRGTMPPLGMGSANFRQRVLARASDLVNEHGGNPQVNEAQFTADRTSLRDLQTMSDSVQAFKNTVRQNIGVLQKELDTLSNSGSPWVNRPLRAVLRSGAGSEQMAGFLTALGVVVPEVSRILTQPRLVGQLTDQAREEARQLLREDYTPQQMMRALAILTADMDNRERALAEQLATVQSRMESRGPGQVPGVVDAPQYSDDDYDAILREAGVVQ
jgi:hypothetical protein